ncbi:hypothetical protein GCM10012275_28150 [Longimycelium tulufanense]|uniref:Rv2525c-like glycoside hydrolase-like domain-containing protein n=1 Tax=Longimycelium tulufanense TaxID=907463 RepID=A0A8J3CEN2_9PSEU|nr:DUF1906 domain-containing protein [Longimycelium tulufanense]GGM55376.1 hypothetical protein GCM10012275_28150 [Longimycelium tulufanense]
MALLARNSRAPEVRRRDLKHGLIPWFYRNAQAGGGFNADLEGNQNVLLDWIAKLCGPPGAEFRWYFTSGYRNEPGSYHGAGKAVDVATAYPSDWASMSEMARRLYDHSDQYLELIHTRSDGGGYYVKNKQRVGPYAVAGHRDHIHLAANVSDIAAVAPELRRRGVDYSWGRPDPHELRQAGYTFAVRYVTNSGTTGKELTAREADALKAAGLSIVVVYQTTADWAKGGYNAGRAAAENALRFSRQAGSPQDPFIYFAVDFDGHGSQVASTFDGIASVIGVGKTGVYGSYRVCEYLLGDNPSRKRFVAKAWQTRSWSAGSWDTRISMAQTDVDTVVNPIRFRGHAVDYNLSFGFDFGQWDASSSSALSGPDWAYRFPVVRADGQDYDNRTIAAWENAAYKKWHARNSHALAQQIADELEAIEAELRGDR